jgi:hypothetical protein
MADTDLLLRDLRRQLDRAGAAFTRGLPDDIAEREEHDALHDVAAIVEELDASLSRGAELPTDWAIAQAHRYMPGRELPVRVEERAT